MGLTQEEVGRAFGKNQSWVSRLEKKKPGDNRYRPIDLDEILAVEDHFSVPRGTLLRMAGRIEDNLQTESVIENDPNLSEENARILLTLYRQMVSLNEAQGAPDEPSKQSRPRRQARG